MKRVLLIVCILWSVAASAATIVGEMYQGNGARSAVVTPVGSAYNANISAPGAAAPQAFYTTTYDNTPYASAPMQQPIMRRNSDDWDDTDVDPGNPLPVGEPYILLLFAAIAAVVVRLRTKKA